MELELGHKTSEHQTFQTKLASAEEQSRDMKKHLEVLKESVGAKDLQITHLQTDVSGLLLLRSALSARFHLILFTSDWSPKSQAGK